MTTGRLKAIATWLNDNNIRTRDGGRWGVAGVHIGRHKFNYRDYRIKAPSWLVKGLLVNGGLSTIYGPPGTTKTFLTLDLGLHFAHGRAWFGRKVERGGVVYVTGEGRDGLLLRMKAWRQEKDGEDRAPFVMLPTSVNLFDEDFGAEILIADVREHAQRMDQPIRLIIFDTLSRMIGSGDEDKARGMRGSNAFLGAVDAAIEITSYETGLFEGKLAKVKDGGNLDPFRYQLSQSVLGQDHDGVDVTTCVIKPTDASQSKTEAQRP